MVTAQEIQETAKKIGRAIHAEQVILFGSYAKNQPSAHSDVDYFVVAESSLPRYKRSRQLYKLFQPNPFSMDILVYTPEEVRKARNNVN